MNCFAPLACFNPPSPKGVTFSEDRGAGAALRGRAGLPGHPGGWAGAVLTLPAEVAVGEVGLNGGVAERDGHVAQADLLAAHTPVLFIYVCLDVGYGFHSLGFYTKKKIDL